MSRQGKGGGTLSPSSSCGSDGSRGGGLPVPVVQQAQQYLEANIKAWMQPTSSQARSREEMPPLPLLNMTSSSGDSYGSYHHSLSRGMSSGASTSGITHQALVEHNIALQHHPQQHHPRPAHPRLPPPPLTSPSSGYSEHSDPYLSLSLAGACDSSGGPSLLSSKAAAFPHSLSFSGCSNHSLLQETSYSSPCGNSFGLAQPSAAASFFARAAQRLNLSTKKKRRVHPPADPERPVFRTNFSEVIRMHPPPVPPGLLRISGRKDGAGIGKVKVMLRICPPNEASSSADSSYMTVDSKKKQLTLYDPTICGPETSEDRHGGVASPKMFAFDAVFSPDDNQAEVCSSSLCDVISSVVGGNDGCLFVYGHSKLGKSTTMIGNSNSVQELGVIPCAIWWLFRAINEQKHRTGARFSVRVSAVEVSGKVEELRDLLADYAAGAEGSGPGVYLNDDPVFGTQLMNHSELRAPTAERATYLLDAALAARTPECDEDARNAHFLFTLHVYQYRVEKGGRGGVAGGRSRLHLFDLGSCEKMSKSRDGGSGGCLSLSALGNVILALFNGQKHVPYKDSKLTQLLKEALGSVTCRAAMIAHVSSAPARYPETLSTLQLASRIHRLRRKKLKFPTSTDVATTSENRGVCRPFVRVHAVGEDGVVRSGSSDPDYTSSSEQSCDTVIFVGTGRGTPMPEHVTERHHVPSPLAKDNRGVNAQSSQSIVGTHKKQASKSHPTAQPQAVKEVLPNAASLTNAAKEDKPSEGVKSALTLTEKMKTSVSCSPKKKVSASTTHSSPKHARTTENSVSNVTSGSPKPPKHAMIDYPGDPKKAGHSTDNTNKGSLSRSSKNSGEQFQKVNTASPFLNHSPVPHSPRKSKRGHKQELPSSSVQGTFQQSPSHQQTKSASSGSPKLPIKELKVTSDETWIDGPRFTKPKFDSRTLHQLQKEKWVDGPGMYGYMDVQKETMIRRWVEDHSKHADDEGRDRQNEVWIDFPPNIEDKSLLKGILEKYVPSSDVPSEKSCVPSQTDVSKKDTKSSTSEKGPDQLVVEAETHHYAKPNVKKKQPAVNENNTLERNCGKDGDLPSFRPEHGEPQKSKLDNCSSSNINESAALLETCGSKTSDENSNCSTDFNDNESLDLSNQECETLDSSEIKNHCLPYDLNGESRTNVTGDCGELEDSVVMVDCCIQVNEEDIFMSCGWPESELPPDSYIHFGDSDTLEQIEHPLRILSAEDLNLASTFSDSRTVSVDLDSVSVPETWKYNSDDLDPNLTWRLLKGSSLPRKCPERVHNELIGSNKELDLILSSNTFVSRLDHLSRLRGMVRDAPSAEKVLPPAGSQIFNSLSCRENHRFVLSNKMHHSADSSLEELRENDNNSIHSEPAELDIEKFQFQFNVKPMNGLRLEAFYNRIHKVPLFPDCAPQFGKPTQVVPPIVKEQSRCSPIPKDEPKSTRSLFRSSKEKIDREDKQGSPNRQRKRWSGLTKFADCPVDPESFRKIHQNSSSSITETVLHQRSGMESPSQIDALKSAYQAVSRDSGDKVQSESSRRSLTEIILEQRCLTYSEGLTSSTPVPVHHTGRHVLARKPPKPVKCVTDSPVSICRTVEGSEQRYDNIAHKVHQRKKGSPKLPPRSSMLNSSSKNGQSRSSKQHHNSCVSSVPATNPTPHQAFDPVLPSPGAQTGVSSSASWTQSPSGGATVSSYVMPSYCDSSDLAQVHRNHILSRSSSTPTSPFTNSSGVPHVCAQSETTVNSVNCPCKCSGPTLKSSLKGAPPKVETTKWSKRQSSSGHGSDSSVISADIKESKELLGKFAKAPQFSGTSSGYESMPRDSEGTPQSSSSQESSSEVGSKREMRGRKGTRKKSQGSGKRSRSVPARAPVTGSPTWQPLPAPLSRQPVRGRGLLVRDIHDPSLWKSEEDVCCTSLLCCRLLDFY